jgi:hypothetical protein
MERHEPAVPRFAHDIRKEFGEGSDFVTIRYFSGGLMTAFEKSDIRVDPVQVEDYGRLSGPLFFKRAVYGREILIVAAASVTGPAQQRREGRRHQTATPAITAIRRFPA